MADIILSEAEKIFIVHGIQVLLPLFCTFCLYAPFRRSFDLIIK